MSMRQSSFHSLGPHGFHEVCYSEWGEPKNPNVLVCVHGLTRNGRDFDRLAAAIEQDFRVICPDIAGRGRSPWLPNKGDYNYHVYVNDMATLIARLDVPAVDWLGTSMGGLIGMFLTAQPHAPIRRMILNDIGPYIPLSGLGRIGEYLGKDPHFASLEAVVRYMRQVSPGFGPLSDEEWLELARHTVATTPEGDYRYIYDPAISEGYHRGSEQDIDLWHVWDKITCPTLVLRGTVSDILLEDTAQRMTRTGPRAQLIEFAGCGHAPMLMHSDQIEAVARWLRS